MMSDKRDLGLNQQNGRIGILFSDRLVDMHMVMDSKTTAPNGDAQPGVAGDAPPVGGAPLN